MAVLTTRGTGSVRSGTSTGAASGSAQLGEEPYEEAAEIWVGIVQPGQRCFGGVTLLGERPHQHLSYRRVGLTGQRVDQVASARRRRLQRGPDPYDLRQAPVSYTHLTLPTIY